MLTSAIIDLNQEWPQAKVLRIALLISFEVGYVTE